MSSSRNESRMCRRSPTRPALEDVSFAIARTDASRPADRSFTRICPRRTASCHGESSVLFVSDVASKSETGVCTESGDGPKIYAVGRLDQRSEALEPWNAELERGSHIDRTGRCVHWLSPGSKRWNQLS
jgi:hypothetical protein